MNRVFLFVAIAMLLSAAITSCGELFAPKFTVGFDSKGGNPTPEPQEVNEGEKVIKPEDPTRGDGTDGAYANSVFVSDSDVFVVGQRDNRAVLWKNSVPQYLTDGTELMYSFASSVFVSGGDVYVAGSVDNNATLWKNGIQMDVSRGVARYVFVVE